MTHRLISATTAGALFLVPFLVTAPVASAAPDTINLTNGQSLEDVTIQKETLTAISYRPTGKNNSKEVHPDEVLSIEYTRMPRLVDEAEASIADGDVIGGAQTLDLYVSGAMEGGKGDKRFPWAPAYALNRLVEVYLASGANELVIKAADRLIESVPDSRHLPAAYLAKAEAQRISGNATQAMTTLKELNAVVSSKGLSERWQLESQLATALSDSSKDAAARRSTLVEVATIAGTKYPTVRNRARVAEGESYLDGTDKKFAKAREVFEKVVADPKADDATKAGAYTGLGDCLFQEAVDAEKAGSQASETLQAALMNYLRVASVYRGQDRYVPKALYYSGQVFSRLGDPVSIARARDMYVRVIVRHPDTKWAKDARNQVAR